MSLGRPRRSNVGAPVPRQFPIGQAVLQLMINSKWSRFQSCSAPFRIRRDQNFDMPAEKQNARPKPGAPITDRAQSPAIYDQSDINIPRPQRIFLDKRPPRLDVISHQCSKNLVRRDRILDLHLQQPPH